MLRFSGIETVFDSVSSSGKEHSRGRVVGVFHRGGTTQVRRSGVIRPITVAGHLLDWDVVRLVELWQQRKWLLHGRFGSRIAGVLLGVRLAVLARRSGVAGCPRNGWLGQCRSRRGTLVEEQVPFVELETTS